MDMTKSEILNELNSLFHETEGKTKERILNLFWRIEIENEF